FVNAGINNLRRSNDKWHLYSGEQSWQADHVVVCAGMGSRDLLATLNRSVPLESQRGYHLQAPHPGVTLSRIVVLADRKIFMNPMQGQLRIAGTVEFGGTGKPMNEQRALLLKDHAQAGLDNLDTSGFTTWLGHRPCLPDSLPVIGPVADLPGLWTGFGHGHLGLTGSINTGRLLARAMAGQTSAHELTPFALSRFR
ncbi:MAG: NAD(P)/FAD-dependent oxidoreductase, partial [Advenella sp.]